MGRLDKAFFTHNWGSCLSTHGHEREAPQCIKKICFRFTTISLLSSIGPSCGWVFQLEQDENRTQNLELFRIGKSCLRIPFSPTQVLFCHLTLRWTSFWLQLLHRLKQTICRQPTDKRGIRSFPSGPSLYNHSFVHSSFVSWSHTGYIARWKKRFDIFRLCVVHF